MQYWPNSNTVLSVSMLYSSAKNSTIKQEKKKNINFLIKIKNKLILLFVLYILIIFLNIFTYISLIDC